MPSDLLILGFDESPKDPTEVALSVMKKDGDDYKILNVFTGEEARELYQKLTKLKGE